MTSSKESTFAEVMSIHNTFLKYLGVMPFDGRHHEFIGTRLLVGWQFTCLSLFVICFTGYGISKYRQGIIEADYICEGVIFTGVYLRSVLLLYRRKQFIATIKTCEDLWMDLTACERHVTQGFVKMIHWVFYLLIITGFSSTGFYVLATQLHNYSSSTGNNGTQHRVLPARFYFDELDDPWYEIVFLLQCLMMMNSSSVTATVDTFAPFLMMMSCGFFNSIRSRFTSISQIHQDDDETDVKLKLLSCVVFHQKVFKLCEEIQKLSSDIFMSQVVCTTYNLSLSCYKLVGDDPDRFKYIAIVSLCFLQLLSCQWPADRLSEESEALALGIYFVPLGHKTPLLKKLISFIMIRCQRPVQMRAGGMVELSLAGFGSMVVSAISFFTVLQSFKNEAKE